MSKRAFMRAVLATKLYGATSGVRTFEPSDQPALGSLMYRAYLDTVDYDGETPDQAAEEVCKTIQGSYGEFMPHCSTVLERAGSLLSATLITRFEERPFVAFTFTDPAFAGQGMARACMQAAMFELLANGDHELRLVVTTANTRAVKLYGNLGFQVEQ